MSTRPAPQLGIVPRVTPEGIREGLSIYFVEGNVYECRVLHRDKKALSGFFDSADSMAKAVYDLARHSPDANFYLTQNPVNPSLLARAQNRLVSAKDVSATDENIAQRTHLVLDIDAKRPKGISSTEEERRQARECAERAIDTLRSGFGWPEPALIDSGNGYHIAFRINLPNDKQSKQLIENALKAAGDLFSADGAEVDQTLFNASRIIKIPGTVARKGDSVPSRPHRLARVIARPEEPRSVSEKQLAELAEVAPKPEPRTISSSSRQSFTGHGLDLEGFFQKHNIEHSGPKAHDGGEKFILEACPFNPEHGAPDSAVFRLADGTLGFRCLHNSCRDKNWQDFRAHFDGPRELRSRTNASSRTASVAPPASVSVASAGEHEAWNDSLLLNKDDAPKACLANAITALTYAAEWDGVLAFDEFALRAVALKAPPWVPEKEKPHWKESDWTATDDIRLADWLQHKGIMVNVPIAAQAVQAVAEKRKFHRVREYLDSLQWNGIPLLDEWLFRYTGVTPNDYTRAVGAKWCISAVARIYDPGCKVDTCLILQGEQGDLKSTALQALAVNPKWFTDQMDDVGTKDSQLQLAGVWIIELSELDSLSKSESGRIKAFLSRQTDRFRPPYGMRLITAPRQCVFTGSVNPETFLKDETGARRFWPVKVGVVGGVDIPALTKDRDQLWAEAVHRYRAGEKWWLDTPELIQQAKQEQSERYEGGVWDDLITKWLKAPTDITSQPLRHEYEAGSVSADEILEHCLGIEKKNWNHPHSNKLQVSRALKANGWERFKSSFGTRPWRYRKPEDANE
jgi:predicted P-loop ATPase